LRYWKRPNLSFNKVKAMDSMVGGSVTGKQEAKARNPSRGGEGYSVKR